MPLSIADFKSESVELTVETSLGPLALRYRPNRMTPLREAQLTRSAADDDDPAVIGLICDLVEWMDVCGPLVDDDGTELVAAGDPVPMEPECVAVLPSRLLSRVLTAIQEDMTDGDPKSSKNGSRGGSFSHRRR